ncbi:sensor histidine kinase [Myroides odoratimimus]|uniref:sensor histidine kinase n=1 Tax=Myroides odoratimimus TaxID=76832 RepID=UPI0029BFBBBF|nr:histidine kinase [Myroides odoratimimus]MDX4973941.1 histidine kinase [Myroides odoratimimus]
MRGCLQLFVLFEYEIRLFILVAFFLVLVIGYFNVLNKFKTKQKRDKCIIDKSLLVYRERERIANELHDGVCSDLVSLLNLLASFELTKDLKMRDMIIKNLQLELKQCYDNVLHISYGLLPPLISDNSINCILQNYVLKVSKLNKIRVSMKIMEQTFFFSESVKLEIYRITQEVVQNIIKHSNATNIGVRIVWYSQKFTLFISDNGMKYNFNLCFTAQEGLGLKSMILRAKRIKAILTHEFVKEQNIVCLSINREKYG